MLHLLFGHAAQSRVPEPKQRGGEGGERECHNCDDAAATVDGELGAEGATEGCGAPGIPIDRHCG